MTSEASVDGLSVCHADDAPRLTGHLPEVSADELWIVMRDKAVAEVACPGCDLLPVLTPQGYCGIAPVQWSLYLALCAMEPCRTAEPELEVAA